MHAHMLITKCRKNKKDDSRSSQLVSGDPMNPSGQVHSARWLMTRQMAYLPHGFSSAHGLIHLVSRQAVYSGQSLSVVQPTATVGSVGRGAKI